MDAFDFGFAADIAEADGICLALGRFTRRLGYAVFIDINGSVQRFFVQSGKIFTGGEQHVDLRQGAAYGFAPFVFSGVPLFTETVVFVNHELVRANPPGIMQGNDSFNIVLPAYIYDSDAHTLYAVDMGDVGLYQSDNIFYNRAELRVVVGCRVFCRNGDTENGNFAVFVTDGAVFRQPAANGQCGNRIYFIGFVVCEQLVQLFCDNGCPAERLRMVVNVKRQDFCLFAAECFGTNGCRQLLPADGLRTVCVSYRAVCRLCHVFTQFGVFNQGVECVIPLLFAVCQEAVFAVDDYVVKSRPR